MSILVLASPFDINGSAEAFQPPKALFDFDIVAS